MYKPKENIDELIACFLSKGTTLEEEEQLLAWITSDSGNLHYYEQMYEAWLLSAQCRPSELDREEQALMLVNKKISEYSEEGEKIQIPKIRKNLFPVFKYVAAIAFLIIGTYTLTRYFITKQMESHITETTYEAHYGSRANTILPDSSKVWLNSGSKLTVQQGYNRNERTVNLIGEAYFDVATNPKKPFIVKAGEISIRATGTAFNVKAYPEEGQITTTLIRGIVYIEGNDEQKKEFKVQMKPNQTVNYKRHAIIADSIVKKETINQSTLSKSEKIDRTQIPLIVTTSQTKAKTLTSWMKDRWIIDNEEFGDLAVQLERRYNVIIRFESEELKQYHFTGTIERETVEQMFEAFRYSIPLKYIIEQGVITLTVDNELKKQYEKAWKR